MDGRKGLAHHLIDVGLVAVCSVRDGTGSWAGIALLDRLRGTAQQSLAGSS